MSKFKVGDIICYDQFTAIPDQIIAIYDGFYHLKCTQTTVQNAGEIDYVDDYYILINPSELKPIEPEHNVKPVNQYDQDIRNFFKEGSHNQKKVWAISRQK